MSDAPAAASSIENGAPTVAQGQAEDVGHKVFAGNLAYSTTDEGLKAFFETVASDIISATVIMRGTRSAGYGFVALPSLEAAEKAVAALDKKELDGRQVIIEIAKPADQKDKEKKEKKQKRRVGRRGGKAVPGEVSEAEANGDGSEAPAAATGTDEASIPKKKKKKSTRKSKAKPADGEAGDAPAAATDGDASAGDQPKRAPRPRKARIPRPPRPAGEDPVGEPSKNMLFVANLGFNIDDAGLLALFTEASINVVTARVVRRSYGKPRKSKGYGFVDVGNEEEQQKAIATLDGKDLEGRNIAVKVAVNTPHEDDAAATADAKDSGADAPVAA